MIRGICNFYYGKEVKSMNEKTIAKVVSIAGLVLSSVGTILSAWAGEKQQDAVIAEKVAKALANQKK